MQWPNLITVTGLGIHFLKNDVFSTPDFVTKKYYAPYGLSWDNNGVYLCECPNVIHYFSKNKNNNITFPCYPQGKAYHQFFYFDGYLYIASNGNDSVNKYDVKNKKLDKQCILKPSKSSNKAGDQDWSHINSVFSDGNRFYIVHHNFKNPSYISVLDMDLNFIEKIENVGKQNHNVCVIKDELYSLSSAETQITKYDLKTKKMKQISFDISKFGLDSKLCYLRGMAKTKDCFVIGITHSHGRDLRDSKQSYLLMFSNNLDLLDVKELPATGQIREIRAISEKDFAHNGLEFPL